MIDDRIGRTSLPVPTVYAYCSEANNPVGAEWLIMEYMPGVEMGDAWDNLQLPQKRRLALDLIDLYDQLFRLKADGCGSIYHSINSVDDYDLLSLKSISDLSETKHPRLPRWVPLSPGSLRMLRGHCSHSINDGYTLGPLNDISLLRYDLVVLGGIEFRAVLHAAVDDPRPIGESTIFLRLYHKQWKEDRRGPFPWDMNAWRQRRWDFDVIEMVRGRHTFHVHDLIPHDIP